MWGITDVARKKYTIPDKAPVGWADETPMFWSRGDGLQKRLRCKVCNKQTDKHGPFGFELRHFSDCATDLGPASE